LLRVPCSIAINSGEDGRMRHHHQHGGAHHRAGHHGTSHRVVP
jgi:hypothetical protein